MAAYTIVPIDHAIKQAITAAVRAVEFKKYHVEPDDVVNALLTDIFNHLFPYNPSLVDVNKVQMAYIPIEPVAPAAAEAVALPASPSPKPEKAKKPRAKKEKEPVAEPVVANAAAGSASAAPEPEPEQKPKKGRGKKEKEPSEAKNLDKLNPTQTKALKKEGVDDPKPFLEFVNALTAEDYKAKTFKDLVQEFKKPKVEVVEYREPELVQTEFNGKTYFVDPESKKVYEEDGAVDKLVGHVGMERFFGMVVPA